MTKNEKLYKQAVDAMEELFSDSSVSAEEAAINLRALKDEIDIRLSTLE